ncbi:MAG: proton-conducting transporter membrane subunit [Planctomycetota bacterium]|jgi:NAD(P)H-quinone oxidoreductase subunit 5
MQEIWLLGTLLAGGLGLCGGLAWGWGWGWRAGSLGKAGGSASARCNFAASVGLYLDWSARLALGWGVLGAGAWLLADRQPGSVDGAAVPPEWRLAVGGWTLLAFDGLAWVLAGLVAFLGWMVIRYSRNYLGGDPRQTAYWGWLTATIVAVVGMVATGNLLLLLSLWTLASLTLHQLLLFHGDRQLARRAAGTKFTLSRLADLCLFSGGGLLCWRSGTWELQGLQVWLGQMSAADAAWLSTACVLLVLGGSIRSAQVPFHFWLPLTLETPTPVSALMHAGIVNAGGFMAIRLSFLLVESSWAMQLLALFGSATALLAGTVMLTQSSIKSMLAWSTIAQMGFMMLQCGCGAFSAALLHLIAHSLYKSHAFLNSGSVLAESALLEPRLFSGRPLSRWHVALCLLFAGGLVIVGFLVADISLWQKPGGVLLSGALCCGIAHWLQSLARLPSAMIRSPIVWARGLLIAVGLVAVYVGGLQGCNWLLQPPLSQPAGLAAPSFALLLWGLVFAVMIGLRGDWASLSHYPALEAWRIHASQGFYLESAARRWFGGVAPSLLR